MEKTHFNSIVFVVLSVFLLCSGTVLLLVAGLSLFEFSDSTAKTLGIIIITCSFIFPLAGGMLCYRLHFSLFGGMKSTCSECHESFHRRELERRIDVSVIDGQSYTSYHCPNCNAAF